MPSFLDYAQASLKSDGSDDPDYFVTRSCGVGHDGELSSLLYTAKTSCGCNQTVVKFHGASKRKLELHLHTSLHRHASLNLKTSFHTSSMLTYKWNFSVHCSSGWVLNRNIHKCIHLPPAVFRPSCLIGSSRCPGFRPLEKLYSGLTHPHQHMEMVTLIPRLPLSANKWAIEVSNTRQSLFMMAAATPSWMERGVASHVSLLRLPFNSRR